VAVAVAVAWRVNRCTPPRVVDARVTERTGESSPASCVREVLGRCVDRRRPSPAGSRSCRKPQMRASRRTAMSDSTKSDLVEGLGGGAVLPRDLLGWRGLRPLIRGDPMVKIPKPETTSARTGTRYRRPRTTGGRRQRRRRLRQPSGRATTRRGPARPGRLSCWHPTGT